MRSNIGLKISFKSKVVSAELLLLLPIKFFSSFTDPTKDHSATQKGCGPRTMGQDGPEANIGERKTGRG